MTEIRIDVDLPHPPERVWKAITDLAVLGEWFMDAARVEGSTTRFTLTPHGEEGFSDPIACEILEADRARILVTQWMSPQLHTKVTVTLRGGDHASGGGNRCDLTFIQLGFVGQQGALRRRVLHRTYTRMFDVELRAALKRLEAADRERDNQARRRLDPTGQGGRGERRRNQARSFGAPRQASLSWAGFLRATGWNMSLRSQGNARQHSLGERGSQRRTARGTAPPAGEALCDSATAAMSRPVWVRPSDLERDARGYHRIAVLASIAIMVLIATLTVLVDRMIEPGENGSALGSDDRVAILAPGETTGSTSVGGNLGIAEDGADTPVLSGTYRTEDLVLGGYEAAILVNNLSTNAVNGWSVRIVLPPLGLLVHDPSGAIAQQTDREVQFSPALETRVVPAGESVRFTFHVQGAGEPVACSVGGHPCAGIPD